MSATKLRAYIGGDPAKLRALASKLQVTESTAYKWLRGETCPGPRVRAALVKIAGIPVGGWK